MQQRFRDEVHTRFLQEMEDHLRLEIADREALYAKRPEYRDNPPDWLGPIDVSEFWTSYEACRMEFDMNTVRIVVPAGQTRLSFFQMFEHTEAAWSLLAIQPEVSLPDLEACIVIDILLVADWSDESSAQFLEKNPHRHFYVYGSEERYEL